MYEFEYRRPADLAGALQTLRDNPEARPLSGGMTLLPSMKMRLAAPSHLVDLSRLPELQGLTLEADQVRAGAAMTHAGLAADPDLRSALPALAAVASCIGDPQVRARGTLGGALANNDPAADYPAALLALQGVVHTDRREIPAEDFLLGMFTTALADDELITAVSFKRPDRAAYAKFSHPASGYAMTGVMVAQFGGAVRVGVTGAAPCAFRWQEAEAALSKDFSEAAASALSISADGLNEDLHAPAAYRANLVAVMTRRAVGACLAGQPLA